MTSTVAPQARLKRLYQEKIRAELKKELGVKNINQVPKLEKIVVSIGLGRGKDDKKLFEVAANTMRKITGQQPVETAAKKSIAAFKLREGNKIGMKATLRGERMYEFMDRLVNIVLPRLRDFHGVSLNSFDSTGNYAIGLPEQSVFPELTFDETTTPHGLQVTFVINSRSKDDSRALLAKLGVPFEKKENQ